MDFAAIKTDCWTKLDDSPTAPQYVTDTTMGLWINNALLSLAKEMNILTSATPTFTAGVASLPADFVAPKAVYDGTTLLDEIDDILDKVADTDATSQFFIPNNSQIQVFGITPTGTVTLWYYASPATLTGTDTPTELPIVFHDKIWLYVKAQYMAQTNRHDEYGRFMNIWESEVKPAVANYCKRKAYPGMMRSVW
jgi:hypothetical protein